MSQDDGSSNARTTAPARLHPGANLQRFAADRRAPGKGSVEFQANARRNYASLGAG